MASHTVNGNGGDKQGTHLRWTPGMDRVLIDTLNEQLALGAKGENGWTSVALQSVIQQVYRKLKVVVTKDQVRNRLKTWRIHHTFIKEMKASNSAFVWDENLNMITADDAVWTEHLKTHSKHAAVRGKTYKHWDEVVNLLDHEKLEGSKERMSPQHVRENRISKHGVHLRWTAAMDRVLIETLNEQFELGAKGEHGWKSIAIQTVIQQVYRKLKVVVTKDQVRNRLKTWKTHCAYIKEMKASNSGFCWDENLKMITADDTVWSEHLKVYPKHCVVRGKTYAHWNEIVNLLGNEEVEVSRSTDNDADVIMTDDDESGVGALGSDAKVGVEEVAEDVNGNTPAHTAQPIRWFSEPAAKRMRTEGNDPELKEILLAIENGVKGISELKDILLTIADAVKGIATALEKRDKRTDFKDLVNELEKVPGITTLEIISSVNKLAADVQKAELFYALSLERREEWFKAGFRRMLLFCRRLASRVHMAHVISNGKTRPSIADHLQDVDLYLGPCPTTWSPGYINLRDCRWHFSNQCLIAFVRTDSWQITIFLGMEEDRVTNWRINLP